MLYAHYPGLITIVHELFYVFVQPTISQVTNPVEQDVSSIPMPSEPTPNKPIIALPIPSLPPLSTVVPEAKTSGPPLTKGSEEAEITNHTEAELSSKEDTASSIATPYEKSSDKVLSKDAALAKEQFKHNVSIL